MKFGTRFRTGARSLIGFCALSTLIGFSTTVHGQPAAYFAAAEGLTGSTLKSTLRGIIDGHTALSYTPGVWNAHKDLYEDPDDSSRLILFYSQASWDKSAQDRGSGSEEFWNREHLWPRSYGVSDSSTSNTDLFNLVPTNKAVNADRGNQYFDVSNPAGGGYQDPAHPIAPLCKENSNIWEPADGQKGWVARAMFYMTTRYSNLILGDSTPSTSATRMARLSTLLDWNRRFSPAPKELDVNQRIHDDYQGNRNPYIDFPEFADAVFVSGPSWGGWRLEHFTLAELLDPAVSGDEADPDEDGIVNLLEMALYSDPKTKTTNPFFVNFSENQIQVTFIRAEDRDHLNLTMDLQVSADQVDWESVDLSEASTKSLSNFQESVTITRDITSTDPAFYRLLITR